MKCKTCCDKGYLGMKAHESPMGWDTSRPCPDCGGVVGVGGAPVPGAYRVSVAVGRTLAQAVEAGNYDWVDGDIDERNFPRPPRGRGVADLFLVHFGSGVATEAIEAELDRQGFRPADLWELLAFGEAFPALQRLFPVVAFGSFWTDSLGRRRVPYLFSYSGDRYLRLGCDAPDVEWLDSCRFLAVRKNPHAALGH